MGAVDNMKDVAELVKKLSEATVGTARAKARLPDDMEKLREVARQAISPVSPAPKHAPIGQLSFTAKRTKAGRELPAHYLVYFLLVELLGFLDLGRWEKVAWSIPIEFNGNFYLVDYRKFGVGIFCENTDSLEPEAQKIVHLIAKGVKVADPFFRWLAANAVHQSELNVKNNSGWLFARYEYLRDQFRKTFAEAKVRKDEVETHTDVHGAVTAYNFPGRVLMQQARWIGIAAVDAFFSWTEHVFIQVAIIQGRVTTGDDVAELIEADWPSKFKQALDLTDKVSKDFYDRLVVLRQQIRNYMAHGSFGKQGEAFHFHSRVGAVPVMLDGARRGHFSMMGEQAFDEESAIATIEDFIVHLWSGTRAPAHIYIQHACLPLILTFARDGKYQRAMSSAEEMDSFVDGMTRAMDDAANMDW